MFFSKVNDLAKCDLHICKKPVFYTDKFEHFVSTSSQSSGLWGPQRVSGDEFGNGGKNRLR
jgi:hypothetical protein